MKRLLLYLSFTVSIFSMQLHAGEPVEMNQVAEPEATKTTAIVNARLIDGTGNPPLDNACVLIRGNRITYAGSQAEAKIPEGAQHVYANGRSVLPGLFDSHFHSRDSIQLPIEYELYNGITSFRDPGHPFKYYERLLNSDAVIPRVFLCGGHLDAAPAVWPDQAEVIATNQEATQAVQQHVARGASAIKIYFRLPVEQIRAACEAAQELGVPVTAHLELVDADQAIRAGLTGIEHITSFGTALARPELAQQFRSVVGNDSSARTDWRYRLWQRIEIEDNPRVEPLLELLLERSVFVSPTLAVFESRTGEEGATPEKVEGFQHMLQFFSVCHSHGVKSVVGSHTSAPFAAKGKAYLREMELMVAAGMTSLEVITAATKNGAAFFGVADRLGTLEVGKQADLILVDGDPTTNISEMEHVTDVMLNGIWITIEK